MFVKQCRIISNTNKFTIFGEKQKKRDILRIVSCVFRSGNFLEKAFQKTSGVKESKNYYHPYKHDNMILNQNKQLIKY